MKMKIEEIEATLVASIYRGNFMDEILANGYFEMFCIEIENIEFVLYEESFNVFLSIQEEEFLLFEAEDEFTEEYWVDVETQLRKAIREHLPKFLI